MNEVNYMLFAIAMLMMLFVTIITLLPGPDPDKPYSRIEFIQYFKDEKTNVCFATVKEKSYGREFITSVQCTDEVLKQIKK